MVKELFNLSKQNKGYIYFIRVIKHYIYEGSNEIHKDICYKYGKSNNLEQRLSTYKSKYKQVELLDSYKVDHMSFREDMIRQDWVFVDYHKGGGWNSEWLWGNESEYFVNRVREVIKNYSDGEIKLCRNKRVHIYNKTGDEIVSTPADRLLHLVRVKHN